MQNDSTLCPEESATPAVITTGLVVDGKYPVTVTCKTTAGSAGGVGGYSIITTDGASGTSLATQSSGSKKVRGSAFVAGGSDLKKAVEITGGNYVRRDTMPCGR